MKEIFSSAAGLSPYLPQILIGMGSIAILLMILIVGLTSMSFNKALKKKGPPLKPIDSQKERKPLEEKMPPPWGRLSEILLARGYFQVGDMSLCFLRALDLLRQRLDTVNFKYFLPWYLMIGPEKSGKSTLMERSELIYPLGKPTFEIDDPNPGIQWRFLNYGIVLDIRGSFFISQVGLKSDEKGWSTVLSLLNRYRARRPIDGILLTIPVSDLYGINKLTEEEIKDRARFMAQKLSGTQSILGLRLPVYVLLTKGDVLPGFESLCQSIPSQNRHNILGWSSPYHPGTAFVPRWIEEAFTHLKNQLNHLRMEILAEGVSAHIRDGVFIFPYEISHLITPLTAYLTQIFKVNSYDESLVLRGIYLVGDSGINIDFSQLRKIHPETNDQDPKDAVASDGTPVVKLQVGNLEINPLERKKEHIFFFNDVLNDKVFQETGLAQPIHHRLISMNRHLNYAKVGIIGFVGLSTIGLMYTYDRMSLTRDYLLPTLGRINRTLEQIPESRINENLVSSRIFETQARQLLDMMNNIERAQFFSLLMPSSWLSPVRKNLRLALKVSFDQIILRTIYVDLLMKSRTLLTLRPKSTQTTQSLALQLQPTATLEFQLFKGFVHQMIELSHNIDKYNRLQESNDPSLIKELTLYTLGVELPKEFIDNYSYLRRVLKDILYPKIDLRLYQNTARETLLILYNHFLENLLSPTHSHSILGQMHYIVNELSHNKAIRFPELDSLRRISQDLNTSMTTFGNPGNNWIDSPYFDAGSGFSEIMAEVSQFSMFGSELVDTFATTTAVLFGQFQRSLENLNTVLLGSTLTQASAHPSNGLIALEKSLALLFSQQFMTPPSGEKLVTNISQNQVVFWNSKLIDEAIGKIKNYEEFLEKNLSSFPSLVQGTFKQIARRYLHENILSLIAKAQTISPLSQNVLENGVEEETLRNKIADVREISPKFIQLLEAMNHRGIGTGFVELRTMLGILSTRLLHQVDQLFVRYKLYHTKEDTFNWWEGISSPILEGFSVKDPQDLKSFLEKQRQILQNLALNYAEPMVTFLLSPVMREFEGNPLLVNKWRRILEELKAYENKRPDNSLSSLEVAITSDLVEIDLKKCFETIMKKQNNYPSGDFFMNRQVELKQGILARCEILQRNQSIRNYQKLSSFFNENLKQKFPFVLKATNTTPEAEPEDIKEFFKIYKEAGDAPKVILDQIYQLEPEGLGGYRFLESMEKVKFLFEPYLLSKNPADVPGFDFTINFRTNQSREMKGNLIIDWWVMSDEFTKISNYDKDRTGKWLFGNEFILGLRWPKVSQLQPYTDPAQVPIMTVEEGVTQFSYKGRWSLLWMLRNQQAPSSDYSPVTNPFPYVLKFNIPNGPTEKTIVYSTITLLRPSKTVKLGKPMRLPDFPEYAPMLPESVLNKRDDPILLNKSKEGSEP